MNLDMLELPHLVGDMGQLVRRSPDRKFEVRTAFMVNFPAEAIVDATDQQMVQSTAMTPGTGFQIHRAAGIGLREYMYTYFPNGLRVGDAIVTPPFSLENCYCIIHTNGPNYSTSTCNSLPLLKQLLADCYRRCLEEAYKVGARSIAFPCISSGRILDWPVREASRIALATVTKWFSHPIFGAMRRERIPGPITFLADPFGPYAHQAAIWDDTFEEIWRSEIWLDMSQILPPLEELVATPELSRKIRVEKHMIKRRSSRPAIAPGLERQDATVGEAPRSTPPGKRRDQAVSERELRDLLGSAGTESGRITKKRVRRPPERYGH